MSMRMSPLLVKDLIHDLSFLEGDEFKMGLPVYVEGCDCYGEYSGKITVESNDEGPYVLVGRER